MCTVAAVVKTETVLFKRRFNFKWAQWEKFSIELDKEVIKLDPSPEMYDSFIQLVRTISRRNIPKWCRTSYIFGLDKDSKSLLQKYEHLFKTDPFFEETTQADEELLNAVTATRRQKWCDVVTQLDMKQNSRKAWKLLKRLNSDPTSAPPSLVTVTPDQIAHQLLLNGKTKRWTVAKIFQRYTDEEDYLGTPFTIEELEVVFNSMKNNKAAGLDDRRPEQI